MLDGVAYSFLGDSVKLSRYRRTNWQGCAIGFNRAFHSAILTDVDGERLQGQLQIPHPISAVEAPRRESRLPGRFVREPHYGRRFCGLGRSVWTHPLSKGFC